MGKETGISWTDSTWNPIRGCSRVSEGCRNCYAESVAYRFSGERLDGKPSPYAGLVRRAPDGMRLPQWNGQIKFVEEHLLDPLKWKNPKRIFVNSMSDLFHENVTDEMLDRIFAVMAFCWQHTFQVLTKRPERMLAYLSDPEMPVRVERHYAVLNPEVSADLKIGSACVEFPLMNVQLGVSVEDQKTADERICLLLQTPAAVRFISAEPLLGPIDLVEMKNTTCRFNPLPVGYEKAVFFYLDSLRGCRSCVLDNCDAREEEEGSIPKLDWVIVGGESGPGARPMHPDWARSLRDQCKSAGVPFFFKQWGEWLPLTEYDHFVHGVDTKIYRHEFSYRAGYANGDELPISCYRVGVKAAGHLLGDEEHHEFPAVAE